MENISYIGKCLVIENSGEKILVVGDIHIGYGDSNEAAGAIVNSKMYGSMIDDFDEIFEQVGKVNSIVLLGDLKHSFSSLNEGERHGLVNLFDYLSAKCEDIVVIKGNHDNYLANITSKRKIKVVDYYVLGEYCFLHGDRDFIENYDNKIKCWVMGHLHPAIKLRERSKVEKYKCFLSGEYSGKKVIILPSFVEFGEGIDVREIDREMPWKFNLDEFNVGVVGENLEVLDFGELRKIR